MQRISVVTVPVGVIKARNRTVGLTGTVLNGTVGRTRTVVAISEVSAVSMASSACV